MPYYFVVCPICEGSSQYKPFCIGKNAPAPNGEWDCPGGHRIYASRQVGITCPRAECRKRLFLNNPLAPESSIDCPDCKKKIRSYAAYETVCKCRKTIALVSLPIGTVSVTCECGAKLDAKSKWVRVLAGRPFEIPAVTFQQRPTEEEELKTAGLTLKEGGRFEQKERIDFLESKEGIAAGFCEGQCLHWIRRVLQNGSQVYDTSHDKSNKVRSEESSKNRQISQATAVAEVYRVASKDENRYDKWNEFAEKADNSLSEAKNKDLNKVKHRFINITLTYFDQKKRWSSVDKFLAALFRDIMSRGRPSIAAMLMIGVKGSGEDGSKISGHSIAMLRIPSEKCYLLFDPNYGVFAAEKDSALLKGASVLINTVWTSYGKKPWVLTNECAYTLFEPKVQENKGDNTLVGAVTDAKGLAAKGQLPSVTPPLSPPSLQSPARQQQTVKSSKGENQRSKSLAPVQAAIPSQSTSATSEVQNAKSFWASKDKKTVKK